MRLRLLIPISATLCLSACNAPVGAPSAPAVSFVSPSNPAPVSPAVSAPAAFDAVWLEPLALGDRLGSVAAGQGPAIGANPLQPSDLQAILRAMAVDLHIKRFVIAYSEYQNAFYYNPWVHYAWESWWNPVPAVVDSSLFSDRAPLVFDPAYQPQPGQPFNPAVNFVDVVVNTIASLNAEGMGLEVDVGLSLFTDLYLVDDIEGQLRLDASSPSPSPGNPDSAAAWVDLDTRLQANLSLSRQMAADLIAQYGSKIGGLYLAHESSLCTDVALTYDWAPLGSYIKSLNPALHVLVSPPVGATSCFVPGGYAGLVAANAAAVDTYYYQDGVGAGVESFASTDPAYAPAYLSAQYTDDAKRARIAAVAAAIPSLARAHDHNRTFWGINTETWDMNGICGKGPYPAYGCARPADFSRVRTQLAAYAGAPSLMLNEGLLNLTVATGTVPNRTLHTDNGLQAAAFQLTASYADYLGDSHFFSDPDCAIQGNCP